MIPFDGDDELRRQLASLGSDLDQTGLPGPSAARKRAAQRTRNQITTGVAAGVAVVALGGLGIVQLLGPGPDRIDPAPPPTTAPTTEATPDPTPITIPDNAFITPDDLPSADGETWEESGEDGAAQVCLTTQGWVADARGSRSFLSPETGSQVYQELMRAPAGGPDAVVEQVANLVMECVPEPYVAEGGGERPAWARRVQVSGVGEEMWAQTYLADEPAEKIADLVGPGTDLYVAISVMRQADLVSIVIQAVPADSVEVFSEGGEQAIYDFDVDTPAKAAGRACTAVFGTTCVTEPTVQDLDADVDPSPGDTGDETGDPTDPTDPTDPPTGGGTDSPGEGDPTDEPVAIADNPFLPDADLNPIGSYGDGWELIATDGDAEENVTLDQGSACVDALPAADVTRHGLWSNGVEGTFGESALQFASSADAAAFVDAHASRPESCTQISEPEIDVTLTGPSLLSVGDAAHAWHLDYVPTPEHPGTSTSFFGAAVAHRENVVVVLTFGAMSDPTDDDWAAFIESRLDAALDAAVGD